MTRASIKHLTVEWQTAMFKLVLMFSADSCVRLRSFNTAQHILGDCLDLQDSPGNLPLTSIRFVGEGNTADKTAKSLVGSYVSERLRYKSHRIQSRQGGEELVIQSVDPISSLQVASHFVYFDNVAIVQTFTEVWNQSPSTSLIVTQLSSITIGGMTRSSEEWYHDYVLLTNNNSWFREAQWREQSLPDLGIDNNGILELKNGHTGSQATYSVLNRGSFSTGSHLPMGLLKQRNGTDTWIWQIEHNGSWRWEIGDYENDVYLAAGGPTGVDHDWRIEIQPGQKFRSVPVAFGRVTGGVESAFGEMTRYRRAIRRPHIDNELLPIIFNDYMNCLMGDPNEDKIKALLKPVAESGAEYFVIDAGWYADDGNWWDDVGLWQPSHKRFPSGFKALHDMIKEAGLIPGLWLEPEVVGVRSLVAQRLPNEAFFQDSGARIAERGRYQLDYRHPNVIEWMNSVIERLVTKYGVGYFKFDYNIEVVRGTDTAQPGSCTLSSGAAHLEHQRAYLSWVRGLLDRYPALVIENCSSGAQRMDYAMLSVHPLQSTSDQQDPLLYAAIAAAAPTAVTPEQSATWAYPQREWSDELNVFTVVNCLLGRVHLSGRLDHLSASQYALVVEGMQVYQKIRLDLKTSVPIWPLGLPKWHDEWLSLGMVSTNQTIYLAVWRRGGPTKIDVPILTLHTQDETEIDLLYPSQFSTNYNWQSQSSSLHVELPENPCARLFRLQSCSHRGV